MAWLISFLKSPYCSNLLFALLHSLWQGPLIAALLYLFFRAGFPKGDNARYIAGLVAITAVVLCVLFTFSILNFRSDLTPETTVYGGPRHQEDIAANEGLKDIVQTGSTEVQSVSKEPLITSAPSTNKADFNWKPLILTIWFVGVVIMLVRAMYLIAGGARLGTGCNALKDVRILEIIENLRKRMKITRKIRVAVSERISIPGVIGFVRSVLFLPASMLSNMPADAMEAILAHELAHIKRYDYLFNFCQMVVEAILFFNPAVWWISRQIRIEREVCCDNAGIAITGRRIRYAEVLVGWAERLQRPDMELSMTAMGFGRPDHHGAMAERIKRIVTTDHKPTLKTPWHIAGMTLLLSLIAIGCLWMGADITVAVAGKVLSPQERIDRITEISKDYGYSEYKHSDAGNVQISGAIKTWDNKPLPKDTSISLFIENEYGTLSYSIHVSRDDTLAVTGTFKDKIYYGTFYILINAGGYAPVKAGPFHPAPGGKIEGMEYVLQKGYPATIKVVDDNNRPVEKVRITGGYKITGATSALAGASPYVSLTTDANGIATKENTTDIETSLTFEADGFELYKTTDLILKPDEDNVIKLISSKETKGMVVSKATGEPVEGARLWILAAQTTQGKELYGSTGSNSEPETVTDENGCFHLRKLRSDYLYLVLVEAEGYMRQYLGDLRVGTTDIKVELGPEKSIKGKIIGDLEKLEVYGKEHIVTYSQINELGHLSSGLSSFYGSPERANVKIEDGIGYFKIEKPLGQAVRISAGDRTIKVDVDKDDLDNVLIDLTPEHTRELVLNFDVPEDGPDIEGKMHFHYDRLDDNRLKQIRLNENNPLWSDWLEIIDNQARTEIPAPGKFSCLIDFNDGNGPSGYWFKNPITVDIPDGDDPYIIDIPVYPAGAIYGTIRRPDGTILDYAQIRVEALTFPNGFNQINNTINFKTDRGTFNVTPLPLDGKYGIIAYKDNTYGVIGPIEINEKNPIFNIDINVPEGVDIHGRLVDADNNPVSIPVTVHIDIKRGEISHDFSGLPILPDEDGRFVIKNVNPSPYGSCSLVAGGEKGYQTAVYEIKDLSKPVLIQLKKGLRAAGVVIDEDTGLPIPGVEVRALRTINQNGNEILDYFNAEAATNEKGEFVFTCMSEGTYRLDILSLDYSDNSNCEITGGQDGPAIFKVKHYINR